MGDISVHDPVAMNTSPSLGSLFGGLQFGYNYVLPSRVLIGIETDFSMPNAYPSDAQIFMGTTPRSVLVEQLDYIATLRGRIGYAFDNMLLYATGGFAGSAATSVASIQIQVTNNCSPVYEPAGWLVVGLNMPSSRPGTHALNICIAHSGQRVRRLRTVPNTRRASTLRLCELA